MTATPLDNDVILKELEDIDRVNFIWKEATKVKIHIKDTCQVIRYLLWMMEFWQTHETFVSIATIAEKLHVGRKFVLDSIDRLIKAGYITITKGQNNRNIYHFNEYKTFQGFSDEFLDNTDLSMEEKGYLAMIQQYMRLDDGQTGKISMTDKELADHIGLSRRSVASYNMALRNKGFLTCVNQSVPDYIESAGLKVYDIRAYGQAIVFLLKKHNDQIEKNTEDIEELKQQIANIKTQSQETIIEMRKQYEALVRENALLKKLLIEIILIMTMELGKI